MEKGPKFFCENCGADVPKGAKSCPLCGRYFASIRCPSCGFVGEEAAFEDGCPSCGYSAEPGGGGDSRRIEGSRKPPARSKLRRPEKNADRNETRSLPLWVYIITGLALLSVVVLFFTAF